MTDRAKRWSNICGIATKSWPASDFNAPSAATDRLLLEPSLRAIRLYIGFVARLPRKKAPPKRSPVGFAQRVVLCYRSARRPLRDGSAKRSEGVFDLHTTGGTNQ